MQRISNKQISTFETNLKISSLDVKLVVTYLTLIVLLSYFMNKDFKVIVGH